MSFVNNCCSTRFFTTLCLLFAAKTHGSNETGSTGSGDSPLLVLSFDGLSAEFINDKFTPNLAQFKKANASAPYIHNTYSADTYNNHFCVATGYCPEEDDTATAAVVDELADDMDSINRGDEAGQDDIDVQDQLVPIWTQNSMSGSERYSGVYMWPGVFLKHTPMYYEDLGSKDWRNRVDTFMSWFTNDEKPANLVMAYFELPGRHMNNNMLNLQKRLELVDEIFSKILKEINKLKTGINFIVLGGKGMSNKYFDIDFQNNYLSTYAPDRVQKVLPAVFMATGPMFNKNTKTTEPVSLTEVYPLLKYLLNIDGKDKQQLQTSSKMTVMKQLLRVGRNVSGEVSNKMLFEEKVADL